MKKWGYWLGYAAFTCAGFIIVLKRILPVKQGGVFLFGVLWIWRAISLLLGFNTYYAQKFVRKDQIKLSICDMYMGIAWVLVSMSKQVLPIIIVSLPNLIVSYILFRRYRNNTQSD